MISILMPIYNGIEYIDDSVWSIIKQTYTSWELIIGINGHPADSIVYLLAKEYEFNYPQIRVVDYPELKGKSVTLNKMLHLCNYDHVALLDVDDIWLPTKLEKQLPFLHYDVIGTQCIYFGERFTGVVPPIPTGDLSNISFLQENPVINSSAIIRKSDCYWNTMDFYEDYDLWLRLWKHGKTFYNIPEVLVKHRIHASSAFNSKNTGNLLDELKASYK